MNMKKTLLFSIIIPNIGYDEKIKKCISTLVLQTGVIGFSYEILICDQSDESTFDKIKQLVNSFDNSNLFLFHSNKKSAFLARQDLILKARGEYILCVDSDDFVASDYLNNVYKFVVENNFPDIIILPYAIYYHGKITKIIKPIKRKTNEEYFDYLLYSNSYNSVWNKVLKRKLFEVQDCNKRINEDKILLIPFFKNAKRIICNRSHPFYYYSFNSSSVTHNIDSSLITESIEFEGKYWEPTLMNKKQIKLFINSSLENLLFSLQVVSDNNSMQIETIKTIFEKELSYLKMYSNRIFEKLYLKNRIKYILIMLFGFKKI